MKLTLRHVGYISDTASSSLCNAVVIVLLHRVEGMLGRDSLPITLRTGERSVLGKRSNFTLQSSVRDGDTADRFFLPMNRNFDLFIDILSRMNSRSIVKGCNRSDSL